MTEAEFVAFLQATLPRMGLRFAGFRNVRSTVRKRLKWRLAELNVDIGAYSKYLDEHPEEWPILDALCRIPISRLYRDRAVYDVIVGEILPERAARGTGKVRVWSAGCASGEEPHTVSIAWRLQVGPSFPGVALEIVATDVDEGMLARAKSGCYSSGSLREVPERWRAEAFVRDGDSYCVKTEIRRAIDFRRQDLRTGAPDGPFDMVLCRNSAFTYLDDPLRRDVAGRIVERLAPGGVLVIGAHESLPADVAGLVPRARCIYRRD